MPRTRRYDGGFVYPIFGIPIREAKEQTADTCARIVLYGTELHQVVNRSGAVCPR